MMLPSAPQLISASRGPMEARISRADVRRERHKYESTREEAWRGLMPQHGEGYIYIYIYIYICGERERDREREREREPREWRRWIRRRGGERRDEMEFLSV